MKRFVAECCDTTNGIDQCEISSEELYAAYVKWAKYSEKLTHIDVRDWMLRNLVATLGDKVRSKKVDQGSKRGFGGIILNAEKMAEIDELKRNADAF